MKGNLSAGAIVADPRMEDSPDLAAVKQATEHLLAGRLAQAEAMARRLMKKPDVHIEAVAVLARTLIRAARPQQAVFELERIVPLAKDDPSVLLLLHQAYIAARKPDKAMSVGNEAFRLAPDSEEIANSMASLAFAEGQYATAEHWYEIARRIDPESLAAVLGLSRIYISSMRGRLALDTLNAALAADLRGLGVLRHLAFQMQYVSGIEPAAIFEAHKACGALTARQSDGFPPRLTTDADPDRKLTVGFLSPDFRQHACSFFLEPIFASRDRSAFRYIAYSTTLYPDAVTQRFKSSADLFRDVTNTVDVELAKRIAEDKVDIAIDLAGHTQSTRIGSLVLRPAPITMSYLGYPSTTGTPGIDYRIVDSITDPPGAEAYATERLIRLDPCFLCFRPPAGSYAVEPPPSLAAGHVTFGSFNVLHKVSEATLDAWAEILKRVPSSRLMLKTRPLAEESVAERARAAFQSRGIDPARLDLMGWVPAAKDHLSLYTRVDIALDTFPYNGTTTSCEAMWMGVPVVTWRGAVHASRVGASLLSAVGHSELIADDVEGYIRTAAELAADTERLRTIRAGLRAKMAASPLCDESGFGARFGAALRDAWRAWCAARQRT